MSSQLDITQHANVNLNSDHTCPAFLTFNYQINAPSVAGSSTNVQSVCRTGREIIHLSLNLSGTLTNTIYLGAEQRNITSQGGPNGDGNRGLNENENSSWSKAQDTMARANNSRGTDDMNAPDLGGNMKSYSSTRSRDESASQTHGLNSSLFEADINKMKGEQSKQHVHYSNASTVDTSNRNQRYPANSSIHSHNKSPIDTDKHKGKHGDAPMLRSNASAADTSSDRIQTEPAALLTHTSNTSPSVRFQHKCDLSLLACDECRITVNITSDCVITSSSGRGSTSALGNSALDSGHTPR